MNLKSCSLFLAAYALTATSNAQMIESPFDQDYILETLGAVPGVPGFYGGLTFDRNNPDRLLIGGEANSSNGAIYEILVSRDVQGHITGFSGVASLLASAPNIDGGLAFGPGDVLFYTCNPSIEFGQIEPSSTAPDKIIDLTPYGLPHSPGGLQFVPAGFAGAGDLKITTYGGSRWYSATLVPDQQGTHDIASLSAPLIMNRSMEGFEYPPVGSPQMTDFGTVLINEYLHRTVGVYDLDANGDPIVATRRTLASGIRGPEGMVFDPETGDLLISDYRLSTCYIIRGFGQSCNQPATFANYGVGLAGTLGVPEHTCSAPPILGTNFNVIVGNSTGQTAFTMLVVGYQSTAVPLKGGTLLVAPTLWVPLQVPFPQISLPASIPNDSTLCNVPIFTQVLQLDAGAVEGMSLSAGLNFVIGS